MPLALKIENLSKEYRLGIIGHGTLYRDLQSFWAKLLNKEDPNSLLGKNIQNVKGKFLALKNINLEVNEGEVLGIIGPNGAGKSTLLKIISRATTPTKGIIKAKGKISSLLEVGTGFHPELTGRENIYLNGAINGMGRKEVSKKLDEIVDFAGVETFLDTPVKRYSSGMHVRLGFAVAAHLEPDILIVDEVLAVGDISFQKKAVQKMEDVSKQLGRTVLFVSHNLDSIKNLCSKCIILKEGKLVEQGLTETVINKYIADGNNVTTLSEYRVQNPKGKFCINKFAIYDSNEKINNYLDRTLPFKIMIEYTLSVDSPDIFASFEIHTANMQNGVYVGTTVLGWSEKHYRRYKFNDEKVFKKKGAYRTIVNVPGYVLNSGKYSISVSLISGDTLYTAIKNKIQFDLYDENSSHMFASGRRGGLVAMPLDWNVEVESI